MFWKCCAAYYSCCCLDCSTDIFGKFNLCSIRQHLVLMQQSSKNRAKEAKPSQGEANIKSRLQCKSVKSNFVQRSNLRFIIDAINRRGWRMWFLFYFYLLWDMCRVFTFISIYIYICWSNFLSIWTLFILVADENKV